MLGPSARYSCFRIPVETSAPPRRRKLRITRFCLTAKARSLRCSSSPRQDRLRGVLPGCGGRAATDGDFSGYRSYSGSYLTLPVIGDTEIQFDIFRLVSERYNKVVASDYPDAEGYETYVRLTEDGIVAGYDWEVRGADGNETLIPLAGPANRQGRSVADNIMGGASSGGADVLGASVVKVCSLTAASVGLNEKQLRRAGREYLKVYAFPFSHATYYPGAKQMILKLLFDRDGKVLGAQGVGEEHVEKQIDVIAAAMRFGGKVSDLAQMELCYAPPYNSAKSPVNMLGFIASNVLDGLMAPAYAEDVKEGDLVLDVRTPSEFAAGHIEGSLNIPLDELRDRLGEVPKDTPIVVTCAVGLRGYIAARILAGHGYTASDLTGGYRMYCLAKKAGLVKNAR